MKKNIPYGNSDFEKIVTQGYYYIDKTMYIEKGSRPFSIVEICNPKTIFTDKRMVSMMLKLIKYKNMKTKTLTLIFILILLPFFTFSQQWEWALGDGGESAERAWDMAFCNGVIITGQYEGELVVKNESYSNEGVYDVFVIKYDRYGKLDWVVTFGSDDEDVALTIDTDSDGYSYVSGYFTGQMTILDEIYTANFWDIYIVKISPEGEIVDCFVPESTASELGYGLVTDNQNNVYLTGWFQGDLTLNESISVSSYGGSDIFVCKLDQELTPQWLKHAGTDAVEYAYKIDVDNNGNSYITGVASAGSNFDGITLPASGVYIAKYDTDGTIQALNSNTGNGVNSISVNQDGTGHIAGRLTGAAYYNSIDTTVQSYENTDDVYVAQFNNNCEWEWVRVQKGPENDKARAVYTDEYSNAYITGSFIGNLDFSIETFESVEQSEDVFCAKYSDEGDVLWAIQGGAENNDIPTDIISINDTIYVTGWYIGESSFGENDVNSITGSDMNFFISACTKNSTNYRNIIQDEFVNIYPNPTKSVLTIHTKNNEETNIKLLNMQGRIICEMTITTENNTFNMEEYPSGTYILLINNSETTVSKKIIKI